MDVNAKRLEVAQQSALVSLVMFAGIIVAQFVTMPITLSYYLLIDDVEMEAGQALKTSMKRMKVNY